MHSVLTTVCWLALLVFSPVAWGWGGLGHRLIANVAEHHLAPQARAATRDLLGSETLASIATWMDDVRLTPQGFVMRQWHYDQIDLCNPEPAACENGDCASQQIELAIAALKSTATKDDKLFALRVLVHLVADIHQPLHAAENRDRGGNDVVIENRTCMNFTTREPQPCRLHDYWDNSLVFHASRDTGEQGLLDALSKRPVATSGNARTWLMESNRIARQIAHTYDGFSCNAGPNTIRLNDDYDQAAIPVVKLQLARAGQRLAAILNDVFK
mgnify:CR=1 FL=1